MGSVNSKKTSPRQTQKCFLGALYNNQKRQILTHAHTPIHALLYTNYTPLEQTQREMYISRCVCSQKYILDWLKKHTVLTLRILNSFFELMSNFISTENLCSDSSFLCVFYRLDVSSKKVFLSNLLLMYLERIYAQINSLSVSILSEV